MMIIGCDFHSQLATSLLAGHGDGRKRRAEAGTGQWRCGTILPASGGAGADRDGSHGELSLAGGSVSRDRSRIVGGHVRAKPQRFTVVSNQTVRIDMDI